ncbi:MAG: BLUF domain-containing protein [Janthinobacterium lividum]
MTKSQDIFRLVYVSRNNLPHQIEAQDQQVDRILTSSRQNNAPVGITGALLFSTDCFAQTLEGPMAAVETVFERIQRDPRHCEPIILQAGPVDAREFGDWSMAYAGRHDTERLRFDTLISVPGPVGQGQVLGLLRDVVLRAAPSLVPAA